MAEGKRISVIMGVHNCKKTLSRAIESVLGQTYDNWELIICDDGSDDGTYEVAAEYCFRFPSRIVLLKNESQKQLAYTLNRCLAVADGEYIARMDGDDVSHRDRFLRQISFLESNPAVDLCGCGMRAFDDDERMGSVTLCTENPDRDTPYHGLPFCHATVMCRRRVYEDLGGYVSVDRTVRCEDRDLWFRFFEKGFRGVNLRDVLYFVCENEDSVRRRSAKNRWRFFKTELYGYKLLKYPFFRYYKPLFNLFKALIPTFLVVYLRAKQFDRQEGEKAQWNQ